MEFKRKFDLDQLSKDKTKKFRDDDDDDPSITPIEDLSNELFYEIFDYLDGCEIYHAFVNLNRRFRQLLDFPSLLFKFTPDSRPDGLYRIIYELLMDFNQHQILLIHLWMSNKDFGMLTAYSINSSFIHLESLIIGSMEVEILLSLLLNLSSLPRLFSLSIDISTKLKELNKVYELIFDLPKLRFMKLSANDYGQHTVTVSLPTTSIQSSSPIAYLVIDHSCTIQNLSAIISYIPHLSRLSVRNVLNIKETFPIISPIPLSNLTELSIDVSNASFDEFERFISQTHSKLKVLRLLCDDADYLDARRWEKFILQYLPGLETFSLRCFDYLIDDESPSPRYSEQANQFFSSFWIERQWILETEADIEIIIHSVCPYKERWFDYPSDTTIRSFDQLSKSMHLVLPLHHSLCELNLTYLSEKIGDIINVAQIYHLTIPRDIYAGILGRILMQLSALDSLRISSLSLTQPEIMSSDERSIFSTIPSTNQITKVYLETMNNIEEVYFLMEHCPHLMYLKVNCIKNMDMKIFVLLILMKMIIKLQHGFRLLSFYVRQADDQTLEQLNKTIDDEKLLTDYSIKRVGDEIFLRWK